MFRLTFVFLLALNFGQYVSAQTDSAQPSTTSESASDAAETAEAKNENSAGESTKGKVKLIKYTLAEGDLSFQAPETWKKVKRRNNIIEMEFAVPGEKKDDTPIRVTMMASGGSIQANLARWMGQFKGTGAGASREKAKIEEEKAAGMPLTVLDISGTFMDSMRGPFGPKVEKPDHRMIAGILQTGTVGNYFFKFVGPAALVEKHSKAFREMLKSASKQQADK